MSLLFITVSSTSQTVGGINPTTLADISAARATVGQGRPDILCPCLYSPSYLSLFEPQWRVPLTSVTSLNKSSRLPMTHARKISLYSLGNSRNNHRTTKVIMGHTQGERRHLCVCVPKQILAKSTCWCRNCEGRCAFPTNTLFQGEETLRPAIWEF